MSGNITRRGEHSWRLKFEAGERDPATGKRQTKFVTVRGTKRDAQKELTRLLATIDTGSFVEPSALTVTAYTRAWVAGAEIAGKTRERYQQLAEQQIIPHLGPIALQKLRPTQIAEWHATLLRSGGHDGAPLASRTVGHAHRLLHVVLASAARLEIVTRNVAGLVHPPKVDAPEIETLKADEVTEVLAKLGGHRLLPIVTVALGAGLRRGEICALRWSDISLDAGTLRVECSMEETTLHGLKIKGPKTRYGRRTIALPAYAIEALRAHRFEQMEQRLALGLGRPSGEDLVFTLPDGSFWSPDYLSRVWRRATRTLGLPSIGLHALRHSHASALIAAGVDVLTISRRLGHATPAFTLSVYGHLFADTDATAAKAIDAAMGAKSPT